MNLKEFITHELKDDTLGDHIDFLEELYIKYEKQKDSLSICTHPEYRKSGCPFENQCCSSCMFYSEVKK